MDRFKLLSIGGNCPVQAEGTIDGHPWYFRARTVELEFNVWQDKAAQNADWFSPIFTHEEAYGVERGDAGWIPQNLALEFVFRAAQLFLLTRAPK